MRKLLKKHLKNDTIYNRGRIVWKIGWLEFLVFY